MNAAQALTVSAASALLIVYAMQRAQVPPDDTGSTEDQPAPDMSNTIDATFAEARNLVLPTPAAQMEPSADLLAMLKRGEALRLTPYRLGDGGSTLGYGRYFPDGGPTPPAQISADTAEQWFADDVEQRGARWVRTYVTAPLSQNQFDALVSMAFNLRPSSFRTIADAVNAGDDPEDAALRYVRAGTNLEAGLRNRRAREIALYREGTYA